MRTYIQIISTNSYSTLTANNTHFMNIQYNMFNDFYSFLQENANLYVKVRIII